MEALCHEVTGRFVDAPSYQRCRHDLYEPGAYRSSPFVLTLTHSIELISKGPLGRMMESGAVWMAKDGPKESRIEKGELGFHIGQSMRYT